MLKQIQHDKGVLDSNPKSKILSLKSEIGNLSILQSFNLLIQNPKLDFCEVTNRVEVLTQRYSNNPEASGQHEKGVLDSNPKFKIPQSFNLSIFQSFNQKSQILNLKS
jgi:hypothetical protein